MLQQNPHLTPAFIFDLDGTLADCSHRLKYIQGRHKAWDKFFEECGDDTPIDDIINMYWILQDMRADSDGHMIICSGRSDQVRIKTEEWLRVNDIGYDRLFMRKAGDYRPDFVVKQEIFDTEIKDKYEVLGVFDDRDQVVNMWRKNGLRCYQVAKGDF